MHRDSWIPGFSTNTVAYDPTNDKYILITNGTCTLDHSCTAGYQATHKDCGCIYKPFEGLVFDNVRDDGTITSWSCQNITDRTLIPCEKEKSNAIILAYRLALEEFEKQRRRRKKKPVW